MKEIELPVFDRTEKTFYAVLFCAFNLFFDVGGFFVVLPSLAEAFGLSTSQASLALLLWLLPALAVFFPAGWLAVRRGLHRAFQAGAWGMAAGALVVALAPNAALFCAGRLLAGLGAGLAVATGYAIVPAYLSRGRALLGYRWIGFAAAAGMASGVLLGGLLTSALSWRLFAVTALLLQGGGALLARFWVAPERDERTSGEALDVAGIASLGVMLALAVFGLSFGQEMGWDSPFTLGMALVSGGCAYAAWRPRKGRAPTMPLGLLRDRGFAFGSALLIGLSMAAAGLLFLFPFAQQEMGELSPFLSGLGVLSVVLVFLGGSWAGARGAAFVGNAALLRAGILLAALASAVLGLQVSEMGGFLVWVCAVGSSLGLAFALGRAKELLLADAPPEFRVEAAALVPLALGLGSLLGVSFFDTVFAWEHPRGMLKPFRDIHANYLVWGLEEAFLAVAGLLLVVLMLSFFGRKRAKKEDAAGSAA